MTVARARLAGLALIGLAGGAGAQAPPARGAAPLPASALAVRAGDGWRVWWRAAEAPARWDRGDPALLAGVRWRTASPGVEWGALSLAGSGEAWRTRVILARIDPRRVRLTLDTAFTRTMYAAWTLDRAPRDAVFAVNAGQFLRAMPWGWVVLDGHQFLPPGHGPLAVAVAMDSSGTLHWLPADDAARRPPARIAWAMESYPALLSDGAVPLALRAAGQGVDVAHRDARLALGRLPDGRLLVALTRFDALGGALGEIPFGLTVPEMAGLMGALGCRDAVLLDGGISAQMLVRDTTGATRAWHGVRKVPMALVGRERGDREQGAGIREQAPRAQLPDP